MYNLGTSTGPDTKKFRDLPGSQGLKTTLLWRMAQRRVIRTSLS